jgi:prepilin-type processing-associated H-X9-DG protein
LAFMMYAHDNNDRMPGPYYTGVYMIGGGYWAGPIPDIQRGMTLQQAIAADTQGFSQGPLWSYISAVWTYHCPGDMRFKRQAPGGTWAFDSYSKTDGMNGGQWLAQNQNLLKLGQVPNPATAIVFMEDSDARTYNMGTWAFNVGATPDACTWQDEPAVNHGDSSTAGFADGHAELHRWLEAKTIQVGSASANGQQRPSNWNGTHPPGDRDINWVIPRYQYAGIRYGTD